VTKSVPRKQNTARRVDSMRRMVYEKFIAAILSCGEWAQSPQKRNPVRLPFPENFGTCVTTILSPPRSYTRPPDGAVQRDPDSVELCRDRRGGLRSRRTDENHPATILRPRRDRPTKSLSTAKLLICCADAGRAPSANIRAGFPGAPQRSAVTTQ
jgi:hypothetical protein